MFRCTVLYLLVLFCVVSVECKVCSGEKSDTECACEPPCQNGVCEALQKCRCAPGYILSLNRNNSCLPVCDLDCGHGICAEPNKCICKPGYELTHTTSHDVCTETGHNDIVCSSGYIKSDNGTCEPKCSNGCIHGTCVLPDVCQCNPGYSLKQVNDIDGLRVCSLDCNPGYKKIRGVCRPECEYTCGNGTCVSPNVCQCFPGYKIDVKKLLSKKFDNGSLCIASCKYCIGECIAPNTCITTTVPSTSHAILSKNVNNATAFSLTTLQLTSLGHTTGRWTTFQPTTLRPTPHMTASLSDAFGLTTRWTTTSTNPRSTTSHSTTRRLTTLRPTTRLSTTIELTTPPIITSQPSTLKRTTSRYNSSLLTTLGPITSWTTKSTGPRLITSQSTTNRLTTPQTTVSLSTMLGRTTSLSTTLGLTSSRLTIRLTSTQSTRSTSPLLTIPMFITSQLTTTQSTTTQSTTTETLLGLSTLQAEENETTTDKPVMSHYKTWVEQNWTSTLLLVLLILIAVFVTFIVWRRKHYKLYSRGRSYVVKDAVLNGCDSHQQIHYFTENDDVH